jgi:hypothetical protein
MRSAVILLLYSLENAVDIELSCSIARRSRNEQHLNCVEVIADSSAAQRSSILLSLSLFHESPERNAVMAPSTNSALTVLLRALSCKALSRCLSLRQSRALRSMSSTDGLTDGLRGPHGLGCLSARLLFLADLLQPGKTRPRVLSSSRSMYCRSASSMRYILVSVRTIAQGQKRQTLEVSGGLRRYSTTMLSVSFAEAILSCGRRWSQGNGSSVHIVAFGHFAKLDIAMSTLALNR